MLSNSALLVGPLVSLETEWRSPLDLSLDWRCVRRPLSIKLLLRLVPQQRGISDNCAVDGSCYAKAAALRLVLPVYHRHCIAELWLGREPASLNIDDERSLQSYATAESIQLEAHIAKGDEPCDESNDRFKLKEGGEELATLLLPHQHRAAEDGAEKDGVFAAHRAGQPHHKPEGIEEMLQGVKPHHRGGCGIRARRLEGDEGPLEPADEGHSLGH